MHSVLQLIHSRHERSGEPPADAAPAMASAHVLAHIPGCTPLVLDSPHSGTTYPVDFRPALDRSVLRRAEDTHVEKLYSFAPELGVGWVEAFFPRIYLDANRDAAEIDVEMIKGPWRGPVTSDPALLQKVKLGKGLLWKSTDEGVSIYDRTLTPEEVQGRIDRCWRPYHKAVQEEIEAARLRHGYSIHINCHSMPSVAASHATLYPGLAHPDFVVGDRDGSTADPALSLGICGFLRERGYSVDYNHPYKGVELVRRHGKPGDHRHSVQIEVNRKLYMDEQTLALALPGFAQLQTDLRALVEWLLGMDPRS